jgi:gas vesicle protein
MPDRQASGLTKKISYQGVHFMDTPKIIAGVIVGAAIGAALGILFSPAKGTVTRRRLARKGQDFVDDVEDSISEFYNEVSDRYANVVEDAKQYATKTKANVTEKIKAELKN